MIVFTETWLNSGVATSEIFDARYKVYRKDRVCSEVTKKDGGGVLIAVLQCIPSARIERWESNSEDLWVSIKIKMGGVTNDVFICAVYLPPTVNLHALEYFLNNAHSVMT